MLLAVEGGGFFSSSASGYSKGLALLFLGRRNEERSLRVSPWNQYQLVEQEVEPDFQLASRKKRVPHGCAPFICFGCAPPGVDGASPPKVGPVHQSETSLHTSSSDTGKATTNDSVGVKERKVCLKSNLKRTSTGQSLLVEGDDGRKSLEEEPNNSSCCPDRRKVQWTDTCGQDLAEIREFEASECGDSDEEFEQDSVRRCECVIQ